MVVPRGWGGRHKRADFAYIAAPWEAIASVPSRHDAIRNKQNKHNKEEEKEEKSRDEPRLDGCGQPCSQCSNNGFVCADSGGVEWREGSKARTKEAIAWDAPSQVRGKREAHAEKR
jgi:hypothetical protein